MRQVWLGLRETVVVGDLVVMMDTVVSLVVHLVVTAFPHVVRHHSVLVVIEMVFEKDNNKKKHNHDDDDDEDDDDNHHHQHHHHHQVESRDSACEDHQA